MLRLLLVDDEPAVLDLFKQVLELASFEVHTAQSATEALGALRDEAFDVVVTDLRMETPLAGFEVVKAARALNPRPAIAVVTAFPVPPADWRRVGADALFVKGSNSLNLGQQLLAVFKARSVSRPDSQTRRT